MAITDLAGQDRLQLDCNCMNLVPRVAYSGGGKSEYREKHEKGKSIMRRNKERFYKINDAKLKG
jgi:hypothetical protein